MTEQNRTPFTDEFFGTVRRTTSFVLGEHPNIFDHSRPLEIENDEAGLLLNAAGIDHHRGHWSIGVFDEPVDVCGRLYPKYTIAVFQDHKPGSRFVLFSITSRDGMLLDKYLAQDE